MWPVTSTRQVYTNPWIAVDEDIVTAPDGRRAQYGVVTMQHPAVFIVAVSEQDEVVLVRVNRHTTGIGWEVPAGGTDGEEPIVAARRELLEETGYVADSWLPVGQMNALNGVCRAPEHVFLARVLRVADSSGEARVEEGIDQVSLVPWSQVMEMVTQGAISDGESVASLMFAALALGKMS
jgi:8-oxo-dGTP pyrophosphatase MutT (NUDIX family)